MAKPSMNFGRRSKPATWKPSRKFLIADARCARISDEAQTTHRCDRRPRWRRKIRGRALARAQAWLHLLEHGRDVSRGCSRGARCGPETGQPEGRSEASLDSCSD